MVAVPLCGQAKTIKYLPNKPVGSHGWTSDPIWRENNTCMVITVLKQRDHNHKLRARNGMYEAKDLRNKSCDG